MLVLLDFITLIFFSFQLGVLLYPLLYLLINSQGLSLINLIWLTPVSLFIGLFSIKSDKNLDKICELIKENFEKIIICSDKNGYLMRSLDLQKVFNKNNSNAMSVSSVKNGVELLKSYDNNHITIIFGSHYIADEVYSSVGKYFDTTNN